MAAAENPDRDSIEMPRIISVDDHVIEPPGVWQDRLAERFKEAGPRSIRQKGRMDFVGGVFSFEPDDDGLEGDWWTFEGRQYPLTRLEAAVGFDRDEVQVLPITYEGMRKGSKPLHRAGMSLRRPPRQPQPEELQNIGRKFPPNHLHESWMDFLYWDAELEA